MADDVQITVHVRDLTGPGFNSVNRNINQLQRQANQMGGSLRVVGGQLGNLSNAASDAGSSLGGGMGLKGQAIGVAAVLGTALLPSISAAVPMLAGLGAVGGGAALAMGDLKKKAKELKPAFEDWKKAAEKAVAPHTEKAVRSLKGAMEDLTPVMTTGAETFGRITEKAAAFADSPAFKGALTKNAQMGAVFIEDLAGSVGTFTQSLLDFGTKSQPALDAFGNLFGGLLDSGLPSMFKELEQGIGGSAELLNGFAYLLNDSLLPSLGRISGSFADAFGPLLGEMLHAAGDGITGLSYIFEGAMTLIEPFADVIADAFRAMNEVLPLAADAAKSLATNVGGALFGAFASVAGIDLGNLDGFTGFSDWVKENSPQIRSAFYDLAGAVTAFVAAGISGLPTLWGIFRSTTEGVLLAVDALVSGLAAAFGDLPGGEIFEQMNESFDKSAGKFREQLDTMGTGIAGFVDEALPRLNRAQIKMNVDEATQNLADLKSKLDDPSLTKERRAKLGADKRDAEEKLAAAKRQLAEFDRSSADANLQGDASDFFGKLASVKGAKMPTKTAKVGASTGSFWASVNGLVGRALGTSYIDVLYRQVDANQAPRLKAAGGPIHLAGGGSPDGGRIVGPGTETSDSIPAMLSAGEYVVRASSVRKYGDRFMDAVNSGTLKVAGFKKGGPTKAQKAAQAQAKSEADARRDARGDLTVSHFGTMAGYQRSEFRSGMASPDSLSSLVNALNQWRGIIMKATHGGTEKSLLKALDSTGKRLLSYEKSLTKVTASLDKAKSKLDDLKSSASQLSNSVKSGVLSSANITRGANGTGPTTVASIMGGLTASRDQATAFSKALADLQGKGLSASLLQQVAEAGIDGGGLETAGALLGASSSEIQSMNALQSQITSAAGSAGKTAGDAVFGSQIRAQQASVTALTKSQSVLTKAMDKLAGAMEKMIEKAFGKKAAGGIIGAASGGLRSGWTMVGEHEPELVRLPFGSRVYSGPDTRRMMQQQAPWASMLNTPRHGAASAASGAAAGGRPEPIVIEIRGTSGSRYEEFLLAELRSAINARGGNAQVVLTGRRS